jgi:hypothetical protein
MPKKLRPAVDLMAFKCRTLKVKRAGIDKNSSHKSQRRVFIGNLEFLIFFGRWAVESARK